MIFIAFNTAATYIRGCDSNPTGNTQIPRGMSSFSVSYFSL